MMDFKTTLNGGLLEKFSKSWTFKHSFSKGFFLNSSSKFTVQEKKWIENYKKAIKKTPMFTRFTSYFQTPQTKLQLSLKTIGKKKYTIYKKFQNFNKKIRSARKNFFRTKKWENLLLFFIGYPSKKFKYLKKKEIFFKEQYHSMLNYFKKSTANEKKSVYIKKKRNGGNNVLKKTFKEKKNPKFLNYPKKLIFKLKRYFKHQRRFNRKKKVSGYLYQTFCSKIFSPDFKKIGTWKPIPVNTCINKIYIYSEHNHIVVRINNFSLKSYYNFFLRLIGKEIQFENKKIPIKVNNFTKKNRCLFLTDECVKNYQKNKIFFSSTRVKKPHHKRKNGTPKEKKKRVGKRETLKLFKLSRKNQSCLVGDFDCLFSFFGFFESDSKLTIHPLDGVMVTENFSGNNKNKIKEIDETLEESDVTLFHKLKKILIFSFLKNENFNSLLFFKKFFFKFEKFGFPQKNKEGLDSRELEKENIILTFPEKDKIYSLEKIKKNLWSKGIRNFFWDEILFDSSLIEKSNVFKDFIEGVFKENKLFFEKEKKKDFSENKKFHSVIDSRKAKKNLKNPEKNTLPRGKMCINMFEKEFSNSNNFNELHNLKNYPSKYVKKNKTPFCKSFQYKKTKEVERKIRNIENFSVVFNTLSFSSILFLNNEKRICLKKKKKIPEIFLFSELFKEEKFTTRYKFNPENFELFSRIGFVIIPKRIPLVFFNNQRTNFNIFSPENKKKNLQNSFKNSLEKKVMSLLFFNLKEGGKLFFPQKMLKNIRNDSIGKKIQSMDKKLKKVYKKIKILTFRKKLFRNLRKKNLDRTSKKKLPIKKIFRNLIQKKNFS